MSEADGAGSVMKGQALSLIGVVGALVGLNLLAGCVAGGAIDYMSKEYGVTTPSDATVNLSDNPGYPQEYKIWMHKSKPKILVQTSVATASQVGMARGLTFGAAGDAPIQPTFQAAGLKYLHENRGPDCKLSNAVKVHDVAWEFDYDCTAKSAPDTRSKGRKDR